MRPRASRTFAFPRATVLNGFEATAEASTASASTISGGSVFDGATAMRTTLRLPTTTRSA